MTDQTFKCPNCRAEYRVIRVEADPAKDREIICLKCGGPLPGREGNFILKYFLLRRSGKFERPMTSVV
jgi:DNA-directed RNA polymerase subunit RPC12/RpoP